MAASEPAPGPPRPVRWMAMAGIGAAAVPGATVLAATLWVWWDVMPYVEWRRGAVTGLLLLGAAGGSACVAAPIVLRLARHRTGRGTVAALLSSLVGCVLLATPGVMTARAAFAQATAPWARFTGQEPIAATVATLAAVASGLLALWIGAALALGWRRFAAWPGREAVARRPGPHRRRPDRRRARAWTLALAPSAVLLSLLWLADGWNTPPAGPVVAGRPVGDWLTRLRARSTRDDAAEALIAEGAESVAVFRALWESPPPPGAARRTAAVGFVSELAGGWADRPLAMLPIVGAGFAGDLRDPWRATAAEALDRLTTAGALDVATLDWALGELVVDRDRLAGAYAARGEPGVRALGRLLATGEDSAAGVLVAVAEGAPKLRPAVLRAFAGVIASGDADLRAAAASHLAGLGAAGEPLLRRCLGDASATVIERAAGELAGCERLAPETERVLEGLLAHPRPEVARAARATLGVHRLADAQGRAWVVAALTGTDADLLDAVESALSRRGINARVVVRDLAAAWRVAPPHPVEATHLLAAIGGPDAAAEIARLLAAEERPAGFVLGLFASVDRAGAELAARHLLTHASARQRSIAASCLTALGATGPEVVAAAAALLDDADPDSRRRGALALARAGRPAASHSAALQALCEDAEPAVALAAEVACARLTGRHERALERLRTTLLVAAGPDEAAVAATMAAELGAQAAPLLPPLRSVARRGERWLFDISIRRIEEPDWFPREAGFLVLMGW